MLLASIVTGCTLGPDYQKPDASIPAEFRSQPAEATTASFADQDWPQVFEDPALQHLIYEGVKNNYDLQVAVARVDQSRELVAVVRSEGIPQLGYSAFGGGEKTIINEQGAVKGVGGGLTFAWEIDVWGRIKRSTEAAKADLFQQVDIRRGVMLTVVSDLAAGYYQLLELDRQLAIARESVASYQKMLNFFTDRYKAGKDSELPVTRTQANLNNAQSNVSIITRQIAQQENALSVLAGLTPGPIQRGRPLVEQALPATPLGSTTELLRRRPDILATEQAMKSANAQIGVAVANFYPRIGLSALGGGTGLGIAGMFQGFTLWNAFANLTGPIFSGGKLEAEYRNRQAFWDETVAQYRKTVLGAFQETSDALIAQQTLVGQREEYARQVQALQHSVDLALVRYDAGRATYFEVLEAEQQLYPAEYALSQTQRDQLIAVVNLYKALGGGWKDGVGTTTKVTATAPQGGTGGR